MNPLEHLLIKILSPRQRTNLEYDTLHESRFQALSPDVAIPLYGPIVYEGNSHVQTLEEAMAGHDGQKLINAIGAASM